MDSLSVTYVARKREMNPIVVAGWAFALVFGAVSAYSLSSGTVVSRSGEPYSRKHNPFDYWLRVSLYAALTTVSLCAGLGLRIPTSL